ncbi:MAG: ABC transporter ATP-binding protein [Desulfobulbaceae bacterium]|nr:ABC transporter ATP-binding protein [Desulfobulbaceae bacterium]
MANNEVVVKTERLSKVYQEGKVEVRAVNDLNLELRRGEFTALCGPSGSGKTTLLNMIGALDEPTGGRVILDGQSLADLSRTELSRLRRDRIGFVFQAYNLVPVLTAFENAEFVLALQGVEKRERRQRTMRVLEEVGIADLADRRPDELSGGQQQRVAIARAIAPEPLIILADEPTANVDSANATGLLDLMERLNLEENITFLFSTHDQRVISRARRIIRLQDGELVGEEEVGA